MRFIKQAAEVLNEQRKSKRRLAVFMCLAAVVAVGTAAALKMYGQAMSHKEKRLICTVEAHQHTDGCYDGDRLVCGQADYLVHTHNDDCYDGDGNLVCHLPEIAAHTHTDACYTEEEVLVCTEQEQAHQHSAACYTPERGGLQCQIEEHLHDDSCYDSETGELVCQSEEHQHDDACYIWNEVLTCTAGGHQHGSDCYTKEKGELQCQIEEHTHDDSCYDENGELVCQMEEHTHDDTCYAWEDVLTCQQDEGPAGHTHTDACYEKRKTLTCGQLELHTHGESCYDENNALTCGLLELKEHTHQEECFETVELTDEEVAVKLEQQEMEDAFQGEDPGNGPEDGTGSAADDGAGTVSGDSVSGDSVSSDEAGSVSGDSVSGDKVSGNSVSGDRIDVVSDNDADVHEHDETCYDAAGGLMCGYEDVAEPTITKTYEDENERYVVTAAYQKDANIPEEAELRAEMITTESDEEYFAKREAEMKETLQDENVKMDALFKIGFYADGKEIEPESDVMVTVQFLDEEGLADGTPMTIIHFGADGNEILGGSHVKDRSTTFKTNRFSDFAAIFRNVLMAARVEPTLSGTDMDTKEEDKKGAGTNSDNASVSTGSVSADSISENDGDYYGIIKGYQNEGTEQQTKNIEKEMTQTESVIISGNYDYKGNGYDVTFHVEGRATVSENVSSDDVQETPVTDNKSPSEGTDIPDEEIPSNRTSDNEMGTDNKGIEGDISEGNDPEVDSDEEDTKGADGEASSGEESGSGLITEGPGMDDESDGGITDENFGTAGEQTETVIQDSTNEKLKFRIRDLGESSKEHEVVMDYIETQENNDNQLVLQILSYSMTYDGAALDLSDCKVTADVSADEKSLKEYTKQLSSSDTKNMEIKLKTAEVLDGSEVNELGKAEIHDGNARMTVSLDDDNLVTTSEETPNPTFTVQYYANLERIKKETVASNYAFDGKKGELAVIDTTEKKGLPQNGVTPSLKKLTVHTEDVKDSKGNVIRKKGALVTETKLEEVYKSGEYQYKAAPNLTYFNKLYENPNYILKEVWVLKPNADSKSTNRDDWTIIDKDKVRFTNRGGQEKPGDTKTIITITDSTVLRLVYDPKKTNYTNDANFYDYDITDGDGVTATEIGATGTAQDGDVRKRGRGINSPENYNNDTSKPIYAFGNGNTGTGLWTQTFEDNGVINYINKRNRENREDVTDGREDVSYAGCTFKIADHLGADGNIVYNEKIHVPDLFNEGAAKGKKLHESTLGFKQSGDEYTLSTARALTDLEVFKHPQEKYPGIWTNNYWPMDDVTVTDDNPKDPQTGGSAMNAKGYKQVPNPKEANAVGDYTNSQGYPASDDGIAHNNMFGMHFAVDFELTKDYVGPLDYLFFGDDDMWVFLDRLNEDGTVKNDEKYNGKMVCDLGGIHSSVGEYVDLWDYIEKDRTVEKEKYRLTFFYTERGLSGSTCFMQFTLPSVSKATPDQTTGNLKIRKDAIKINGDKTEEFTEAEKNDMVFDFNIKLTANESGLDDDYSYTIYKKDGNTATDVITWEGNAHNGTDFSLRPGEYMIIKYLPIGMSYTITEKNTDLGDYRTDISIDETSQKTDAVDNRVASGTITEKGKEVVVKYKNKLHIYELPHTGGFGTMLYTIAGVAFVSLGAGFMYRRKSRKGGI